MTKSEAEAASGLTAREGGNKEAAHNYMRCQLGVAREEMVPDPRRGKAGERYRMHVERFDVYGFGSTWLEAVVMSMSSPFRVWAPAKPSAAPAHRPLERKAKQQKPTGKK